MFFDLQLLRHPSSPFTIPWMVSTVGIKHIPKNVILQVNIIRLCEALEKYFISQSTLAQERLSLKLSSNLLDGTALILREQASILYIDVKNAILLRTFRTESSLIGLPDSMGIELFTPPLVVPKKRRSRKPKRAATNADVQTFRSLFDEFEQINLNELEEAQADVILQSRVDEITLRENQNVIPTDMILDEFDDFGQPNLQEELIATLDNEPMSEKPPAKRLKKSKEPEPVEVLGQQPIEEDIALISAVDQEVNLALTAVQADVAGEKQQQTMEQDLPVIQPQAPQTPVKRKAKVIKNNNQNETKTGLSKTQNKMLLKLRPMKKLVTEKPALKTLVGVDLLEKKTPFINFEMGIKPYLDRYLATDPPAPSPPSEVEKVPEIFITPPAYQNDQSDVRADSLLRTYTEVASPLLQQQQRVSDKIVEPSLRSSLPSAIDAAMIENVFEFIPPELAPEPSKIISPNLNLSSDHKSRQNNIIKYVMDAEQDKLFELDELAGSPLNKRNAARCFSDLLDLAKASYLNLIPENDSQELKFIQRGSKLLN